MDEHVAPPPPRSSRRRLGVLALALVAVVALVGAAVGTGFSWVTDATPTIVLAAPTPPSQ